MCVFFPAEKPASAKALSPEFEELHESQKTWGVRSHWQPHHWGCEDFYKTSGFYSETGSDWRLSRRELTQPDFYN